MDRLIQFIISNAVAAMALAFFAAGVSRVVKRPPVTRALWIIMLLKLLTPPIWNVPVSLPDASRPTVAESKISVEPIAAGPVSDWTFADEPTNPDADFVAAPTQAVALSGGRDGEAPAEPKLTGNTRLGRSLALPESGE